MRRAVIREQFKNRSGSVANSSLEAPTPVHAEAFRGCWVAGTEHELITA